MLLSESAGAARVGEERRDETPESLRAVLVFIVRHRVVIFVLSGLVFVSAFNGQWRISRDSAAYRGIARNLVRTHTYVFRPKLALLGADKQDTVYPGLPLLLAGLNVIGFGESTLAALLIMNLMALATLILVYKLCRLVLPPWLAIAVTAGVCVNRIFVEQSNEILSDIPFLLGLVMSLYGYEKLRPASTWQERGRALAMVIPGLILAASMRPTFWILAVAWIAASGWGLIRPRGSRAPYAIALAVLAVLAVIGMSLDPRTRGFHPLAGGYEARAASQLSDLRALFADILHHRLGKMMKVHLPLAFFGTAIDSHILILRLIAWSYSLMLIGSGVWLIRRNVLWGLLVLISIGTLALLGDVPRYYLMLVPMLLAGWGLFCYEVARRMNWWKPLPAMAMIYGIGIVAVPNFIRCLDLAREQHGFDHQLRHKSFIQVTDDGKRAGLVTVAEMVKQYARPDQRILGPDPSIVSYLSDRNVYGIGHLVSHRGRDWLSQIASMKFDLVILPPRRRAEIYDDKEKLTGDLIDAGYFRPTRELARDSEGFRLCEFQLVRARARHRRSAAATAPSRRHGAAAPGN